MLNTGNHHNGKLFDPWERLGKKRLKLPCDNARNPSDPDSSFNSHYGQGYKMQVMETFTKEDEAHAPDMITHVEVTDMTKSDVDPLKPALNDAGERGLKPGELLTDTLYGTHDNRKEASERGVEIVAPSQPPKNYKSGVLSLEHFEFDAKGMVTECPAGGKPTSTWNREERFDARFDRAVCSDCELADKCPCGIMAKKGRKPRLQYKRKRVERRERLLAEKSDEFRNKYRWRAGVEATISRLKHKMNLARLRVRGRPAVTYVVCMRAVSMNIRNTLAI